MDEKKEQKAKLMASLFFILGIVMVLAVIFTIGSNKGFIKPKFQVAVLYRNVGGLMEGAPVLLSGVNVGNVAEIDFLSRPVDGRRVKVVLNIFSRYRKQLQKNAVFSIKTEGILGEKLIEIEIVEDAQEVSLQNPLIGNQPIIGEDPLDVQDLADVFTKAAESFTKTSEELSKIDILELSKVMEESSRALLMTAEGLNAVMDELHYMTIKSNRILDRVEQKLIEGELFKLF